jgi:hypothetical protein
MGNKYAARRHFFTSLEMEAIFVHFKWILFAEKGREWRSTIPALKRLTAVTRWWWWGGAILVYLGIFFTSKMVTWEIFCPWKTGGSWHTIWIFVILFMRRIIPARLFALPLPNVTGPIFRGPWNWSSTSYLRLLAIFPLSIALLPSPTG